MLTGKKKKLLSEKAELAKTMNKYFTNLEKILIWKALCNFAIWIYWISTKTTPVISELHLLRTP